MTYRLSSLLDAPSTGVSNGKLVLTEGTHYLNFPVDSFSAENGFHLYLEGYKGGLSAVTIAVETAICPSQTTWTSNTPANFGTDQAGVETAELTIAIPIPTTSIYPPHGRLKIVVPAACVAALTQAFKSGGN